MNVTMDINEFKEILDNINRTHIEEALQELKGSHEACNHWLAEVYIDLNKPKRKSCFLVPKTPRKLRRKKQSEGPVSVDNVSTSSPSSTRGKRPLSKDDDCDGKITRPSRAASRTAVIKIKEQAKLSFNLQKKLRQETSEKISADSTVKRMSEIEECQPPSKNRRLDETFPKLTVSISDINLSSSSETHISTSVDSVECSTKKKSNSFRVDSKIPSTVDSSDKDANLTFNIDTKISTSSPIQADVQTPVDHRTSIKEGRAKTPKSNQEIEDILEITPKMSPLAGQKHTATVIQSVTPSVVLQSSPEDTPKVHSHTFIKDKTSSSSIKQTPSDVLAINRDKKSYQAAFQIKQSFVVLSDIMAQKSNDKAMSPVLSNAKRTSKHGYQNSSAKGGKIKKITEVFSPYAKEPIRERIAAFESLRMLNEPEVSETAQVQTQMRVTRTKTRAMAKAAAKATEKNDTLCRVESSIEPSKNIYSQSAWKAARKSVAKAKVRKNKKKQEGNLDDSEMSKENSMVLSSSKYMTPVYRAHHHTPLSSSNINNTSANSASHLFNYGSSSKSKYMMTKPSNIVVGIDSFIPKQAVKPTLNEIQELKEEEIRRKEERMEETRKKRDEALKARIEERKRKREERMKKVLQQREALEQKKLCDELRLQKEKEEKLKHVIQEREDRIKVQMQQKKQQAQQKAAEIEERRRVEEAARLAKLKEQEEEQRQLLAAKKKEQEEATKVTDEKDSAFRDKQAKLIQLNAQLLKEKQMKVEEKLKMPPPNVAMNETFEIPLNGKVPNLNSYEIDSSGSDSSADESNPKHPIPHWARRDQRSPVLKAQVYIHKRLLDAFFTCEERTPNIMAVFKEFKTVKNVSRSSSAVWRTPPRYSTLPKY